MSDPSVKITKRVVDAAKPTALRRVVWDAEVRGFGLRIEPSGTKTFIVRFRPKGTGRSGPKRFLKLGRYGVLTPEEARTAAKDILGRVARGEDPAANQRSEREAPTFAQVAEDYLLNVAGAINKPRTVALYRHYLMKLACPELGPKKIGSITHAEILKLHGCLGKTRPVTANRVVDALSGLFRYAAKIDLTAADTNPAKGIKPFREQPKQRFLNTDELARLGSALVRAETEGLPYSIDEKKITTKHAARPENRVRRFDRWSIAAIRLLIFTGARLREILHARWEWFDAERGLLLLPDSKTGSKPLFLGAAAQEILTNLPRIEGNPFIFPSIVPRQSNEDARPRFDLKKPWAAVIEAANLPGVRLHDLRHTFAAHGAAGRLGLHIIGGLLGHAQPKTTQRYAHLDADPLHRAVNTIGSTLLAAMEGRSANQPKPLRRQQVG